jgi:hypothetical protein
MKIKIIIAAVCVATAMIFCGCGKDKYNPSEKISKIYHQYDAEYGKELSEIWEWDGNNLSAIYWEEDKSEGFKFEYDKKDLITKVSLIDADSEDDLGYLKYTYDGKKLDKVEYCGKVEGVGEVVAYRLSYEYSGSKISKISFSYNSAIEMYDSPKKAKKLLSLVLPKKAIEKLPSSTIATKAVKANEEFIKTVDMEWTWEKDNITKLKSNYYGEEGEVETETESFKYDTKNSPFYNFPSSTMILEYGYFPSKNNIVREQWEGNDYYSTYEIKYNDKDYPTEATRKSTGSDGEVYVGTTTYYEYK